MYETLILKFPQVVQSRVNFNATLCITSLSISGVLSRGEGNPSREDNPRQIVVLQVGGLSRGQLLHTGKLFAINAQRGNAGQIILGRPRHVKRMKEAIKSMNVRNWKKVVQNRDSWKKVVEQTRTL